MSSYRLYTEVANGIFQNDKHWRSIRDVLEINTYLPNVVIAQLLYSKAREWFQRIDSDTPDHPATTLRLRMQEERDGREYGYVRWISRPELEQIHEPVTMLTRILDYMRQEIEIVIREHHEE